MKTKPAKKTIESSAGRRRSQSDIVRAIKFETAMTQRQSRIFIADVTRIIKEQLLDGLNLKIQGIGSLVQLPIDRLLHRPPHRPNTDLVFIPRSTFLKPFDLACGEKPPKNKMCSLVEIVKKRMPHIVGAEDELDEHPIHRLIALWRQDLVLSTQVTLPALGAITSRYGAGSALKKKWAEIEGRDEVAPFYVDFQIDQSLKSELLAIEKRNRLAKAVSASEDKTGMFQDIAAGVSTRRDTDLIPPPPVGNVP